MNRRSFLQLLGLGAAGAVVAQAIPAEPSPKPIQGLASLVNNSSGTYQGFERWGVKIIEDSNCPPDKMYAIDFSQWQRHPNGTFSFPPRSVASIKNLG